MPSPALEELLGRALAALELPLGTPERDQLLALAELVEAWASRINLTGHRDAGEILTGLIVEALALERVLPPCASILDLGSGAGFPGIPIAIVRGAQCHVTLLDARERRHHFQKAAIRTLGLANVKPLLGRAETLVPEPHDVVLAQALAQPREALELMRPWARPGGTLGLAVSEPPKLGSAEALFARTGIRRYSVPLSGRERVLWLGELAS